MPDQPDDAPKRPPRGVFPPFFVPRNGGHAGGSPTPPSGSWRRVSRLFTPPEGTRQRRTPVAPQAPYTPPAMPSEPVVPVESLAPEEEVAEQQTDLPAAGAPEAIVAAAGAPEAIVAPQDATEAREAEADALELEHGASDEMAGGVGAGAEAELSAADAFDPGSGLFSPHSAAPEPGEDLLEAIAELAFGDDADDFMVEPLEPKPITLDPSEVERMDVAVDSMDEVLSPNAAELEAEPFSTELTYDEMYAAGSYEETRSAQPEPTHEELESVERYLAEDPAQVSETAGGQDAPAAHYREEIVAYDEESSLALDREFLATEDRPSANTGDAEDGAEIVSEDRGSFAASEPVREQAAEIDPWAGAELPEPAFGSIGWPAMDDAPPAPGPVDDGVDEMGAALAWSDDEGVASAGELHGSVGHDAVGDSDDALSAIAGELRESSSAWKRDGDFPVDERADVEARAHFYAAPEPIGPEDEIAAAAAEAVAEAAATEVEAEAAATDAEAELEALGVQLPRGAQYTEEMAADEMAGTTGDAANPADDHSGAAIADALARVAARIRSGEIDLPSEAVGASDESALAAALAALLRGPRH